MCRLTPVIVAFGIALLLPAAAAGTDGGGTSVLHATRVAPVIGPDFRVSSRSAVFDERSPALAWNTEDAEYLAVWEDGRNEATRGTDIYGRRISATGTALSADIRISGAGATEYEWAPAAAFNGSSQEYLIVWDDRRNGTNGCIDIYGRRVSAEGAPMGPDFRINGPNHNCYEDSSSPGPAVAWSNTANEYLVVWQDQRNASTRGMDIYGQRVAAAGSLAGQSFRISGIMATSFEGLGAVVWNAVAQEYLVVFEDWRNVATRGSDVYGSRVSVTGVPMGPDFRISGRGATSHEGAPAVASIELTGDYLVVWADFRNGATRGADIYGRRVSAAGVLLGSDFRISGRNAVSFEGEATVGWSETAGEYLVAWMDQRNYLSRGDDIFGRLVSVAGTPVGSDFRISGRSAVSDERAPVAVWNGGAGEFVIVWQDGRNAPTRGLDLFGRRVAG